VAGLPELPEREERFKRGGDGSVEYVCAITMCAVTYGTGGGGGNHGMLCGV